MPHNVFLSYQSDSRPSVDAVRVALERAHIACWMDHVTVEAGQVFLEAIHNGLKTSDLLVLFLTEKCTVTDYVAQEVLYAISTRMPILVIRLENFHPTTDPISFVNREQRFDAFPKDLPHDSTEPYTIDPYIPEIVELVRKKLREDSLDERQRGRRVALTHDNSPVADIGKYVKEAWIDGFLIPTLAGITIKQGHEEGLSRPFEFQGLDGSRVGENSNLRTLASYFEFCGGRLVITGAKGAGKTILALQMVRDLLPNANRPEDGTAPIYLHAGSWVDPVKPVADQQSIKKWVKTRLIREYHLDGTRADYLIEQGRLIYCFDGLDDLLEGGESTVAPDTDPEAAERDRQFRQELLGKFISEVNTLADNSTVHVILVASTFLLEKVRSPSLNLFTMEIKPWTREDLLAYLKVRGLGNLAAFLDTKPLIQERLIRNFFELQMLATIYTGETRAEGLEARASDEAAFFALVYETYARTRYENYIQTIRAVAGATAKGPQLKRAKEQAADIAAVSFRSLMLYLPSIASYVSQEGQDHAFRLDNLQPSELPRELRERYRWFAGLAIGAGVTLSAGLPVLACILMECAIYHRPPLKTLLQASGGFFGYVLVGLIIAVAYRSWRRWKFGAGVGVAFGLGKGFASGFSVTVPGFRPGWEGGYHNGLAALAVGIPLFASILQQSGDDPYEIAPIEMWDTDTGKIVYWLLGSAATGVVAGLTLGWAKGVAAAFALGVFSFVRFGRKPRTAPVHLRPNQAIFYSFKTAMINGNVVAASTAIVTTISYAAAYKFWNGITSGVMAYAALVLMYFFGGMPVAKHIALRYTLRSAGLVPKGLACWLRVAANIGIMKQAGGAYVFSSGNLREQYAEKLQRENGKLYDQKWGFKRDPNGEE